MSKRTSPSKSFNTVKHSNREQRIKRRRRERLVLLSILAVGALLALTVLIFLIASIANTVASRPHGTPAESTTQTNDDTTPSNQTPLLYTQITKMNSDVHTGVLQIVNNENKYQFPTTASDLKNIYDNRLKYNEVSNTYLVGETSWKLNATALDAFNQMLYRYYELEQDGSVCITSAYRTEADQAALGSSVSPGYSDHHTGYCVAIKQKTQTGNVALDSDHWIYENCHKYGFIVRYPESKSEETGVSDYTHCLRYVGVAHATYIAEHNLCMEEYITLLQEHYTSEHLQINGADGKTYEVYYVAAGTDDLTKISVPSNYSYTISGDNIKGFIITVDLTAPIA